ncbi:MAG: DegT/DnrJ/EryC1/StrS family aminotransferase, partial [Bacteroidota bacterium]
IPFSPPRIDEESIAEVVDTLRSGWITTGPKTKLFEKKLEEYCEVRRVLCLNSATAAMEMALRWYGIGPGDEVIIPAYTYCATANVVVHVGAKPVMVDCDEDFNISLDQIKSHISSKTKAIVPVDIGGYPCDYDEIYAILKDPEIKSLFQAKNEKEEKLGRIMLLADAAHSIGAEYKGKKSGALADASAFSFHAVKNLTTAEGGALCLNLPEEFDTDQIYRELNTLSLHGQSKDAFSKMQVGAWKYDVSRAGYKCNMTDINASLGLVELGRYQENLEKRKEIFSIYNSLFSDRDQFLLPPIKSAEKETSYHLYLLRVRGVSEDQRNAIIQEIAEENIAVNVHFIPLPLLSQYKRLGYDIVNYPKAYANYACEISLPVYFNLSSESALRVGRSVIAAVKKVL